jgi:hypothetical protein
MTPRPYWHTDVGAKHVVLAFLHAGCPEHELRRVLVRVDPRQEVHGLLWPASHLVNVTLYHAAFPLHRTSYIAGQLVHRAVGRWPHGVSLQRNEPQHLKRV